MHKYAVTAQDFWHKLVSLASLWRIIPIEKQLIKSVPEKDKTRQIALPGCSHTFWLLQIVFAFETVYTAACINEFLFSCEERMAVGADLHFQRLFHGTGFKFVAACAANCYYVVLRMNVLFHLIYTSFRPESFAETELYKHISDSSMKHCRNATGRPITPYFSYAGVDLEEYV